MSQAQRAPEDLKDLYTTDAGDNLFNGMIIEIEGEERLLVATKPNLVFDPDDWPNAVDREGKDFKIKSVFKSSDGNGRTQIDLMCEDVTSKIGKCGGYTTSVGTYAPDDPFTKSKTEAKDQGSEVDLECKEGYRAVPEDCEHSGRVDAEAQKCFVTDEDGPTTRLYRICSGCTYVMPVDDQKKKQCKPLTCASDSGLRPESLENVGVDVEWTESPTSQIS